MSTTIAQALKQATRLQGRIDALKKRAASCVSWRKDQPSEFDFNKLVSERMDLITELVELKARIDAANARTMVTFEDREMSQAQAIREERELRGQIRFYKDLVLTYGSERVQTGTDHRTYEPTYETVEYESAMTEAKRVELLDDLQCRINDLNDNVIDVANGTNNI